MLPWVDGCWSSFVAWLCRWCWWCFWRCHWSSHGRRRRLWNACGRISASDATGGTRSLLTNIFVGVSPQRRNTVLPFTTFNPHIVTSFFIFFIQSSPALSSPVFGLLRPDSHVLQSLQLSEGQQGRMPGAIFFGKAQVVRQEVLQLFYVVEHHLIRKG